MCKYINMGQYHAKDSQHLAKFFIVYHYSLFSSSPWLCLRESQCFSWGERTAQLSLCEWSRKEWKLFTEGGQRLLGRNDREEWQWLTGRVNIYVQEVQHLVYISPFQPINTCACVCLSVFTNYYISPDPFSTDLTSTLLVFHPLSISTERN